jgi:hypothetical protein
MNYFHRHYPITQSAVSPTILLSDPVNRISTFTGETQFTTTESVPHAPTASNAVVTRISPTELREHHVDNHPTYHLFQRIFQELENLEKQTKNELEWFKSHEFVSKLDLKQTEEKIMSQVSNFATTQNAFNDRMDIAVTDLQGDVSYLVTTINSLQNSSGSVFTQSDQALLDALSARASTIAAKLDALDAYASANSSGSNSGSYSGSISGSNSGSYSGSYSGSTQGPLSGSYVGTYTGTITDLSSSTATVVSASMNGIGSGAFTGSINGNSISGTYVGGFTGSFNNQVVENVILNGTVVATYTVVQNASASLARQFNKSNRR